MIHHIISSYGATIQTMNILQKLETLVKDSLTEVGFTDYLDAVEITESRQKSFGDFSTSIALTIGNTENQNPREVAQQLTDVLQKMVEDSDVITTVEVAGPGFINIFLQDGYLISQLQHVLSESDAYGQNNHLNNEKTIIEFTDTNPFKEMHIGHLMGNVIGESLARILTFNGATVKRANYQGDVGLQIAKPVWALKQWIDSGEKSLEQMQDEPLSERVYLLGQAYAYGAQAYEDDEEARVQIQEINKHIFDQSDDEIMELYKIGRTWSLDHFETIYEKLGTKFDYYFFEGQIAGRAREIVKQHTGDVFVESDGAVVFPGEQYDLHRRVFINSLGLPTYEAKELALAPTKYETYSYDRSIIVTATEIKDYFDVINEAMRQIFPELAKKTHQVLHGLLQLTTGKMSSRTGDVITGESLITEMTQRAMEKVETSGKEIDDIDKETTALAVGVAAIKFSILSRSIGKNISFDPNQSLSFEGDTGPYLQYTYARAQSILREVDSLNKAFDAPHVLEAEERELLLLLAQFPLIVEDTASQLSPHLLAVWLITLAQSFNSFYAKHHVLGADQEDFRIALVAAVSQVLHNGLWLLGIRVVEKM